jgi:hypothetical protein
MVITVVVLCSGYNHNIGSHVVSQEKSFYGLCWSAICKTRRCEREGTIEMKQLIVFLVMAVCLIGQDPVRCETYRRMFRGGSWNDLTLFSQAASRQFDAPESTCYFSGNRLFPAC